MPRASSALWTASAVRDIKLSPRSNLLMVEVDTHAISASCRTPICKAARAIQFRIPKQMLDQPFEPRAFATHLLKVPGKALLSRRQGDLILREILLNPS